MNQTAVGCRLIELGDDLLTAIALPRVHDQVVPNTTFVEHWSAGIATFFFPEDEIQVQNTADSRAVQLDGACAHEVACICEQNIPVPQQSIDCNQNAKLLACM